MRDSTQQQLKVTRDLLGSRKVRCGWCYREGGFGVIVTCVVLSTFLSLRKDPTNQHNCGGGGLREGRTLVTAWGGLYTVQDTCRVLARGWCGLK